MFDRQCIQRVHLLKVKVLNRHGSWDSYAYYDFARTRCGSWTLDVDMSLAVKASISIIESATSPRNAEEAASAPEKALPPILVEFWPGAMHATSPHIRTDLAESSNRTLKETTHGTEWAPQRPLIRDPKSDIWGICRFRGIRIRAP